MTDNTTLPGTGDVVRDKDRTGIKTQIVLLDLNTGGAEALMDGAVPVQGFDAHDASVTKNPVLIGGVASAAAPADVSADGEAVRLWALRNGAQVVNLSAAGALMPGDATTGLRVNPQSSHLRVTVTPTISTSLYAVADQIGGVMTFANAGLANGGKGRIVNAVITSRDTESPVIELWIFQVSPTMVNTDNGVFDITDANLEAGIVQCVIEFVSYNKTASGEVSFGQIRGQPLSPGAAAGYVCGAGATSLYGIMCIRSASTYASTADVVVSLDVRRES